MTARRTGPSGLVAVAAILAAWYVAAPLAAATGAIRVTPLVTGGRVFASFTAPEAFTSDSHAVMQSGLVLTFAFTVELRRSTSVWWDRTLSATSVGSSVKFDNLTGVYHVSKLQDDQVTWSERTRDAERVRVWMTTFDQVPVGPGVQLEPNADYYLRVRLHASPRRTFSLFPWGRNDGSGRATFTFIR